MARTTLAVLLLLAAVLPGGAQFPQPGDDTVKLVLRGKSGSASMAFSPDGRRFAAADVEEIVLWDTLNSKETMRLQGVDDIKRVRDREVTTIAFNADGTLLAGATYGGVLRVWDAATGKERLSIKGRRDPFIAVAFHADNKSLVSISGPDLWAVPTYEINVWDLKTGRERRAIRGEGASFGFGGLSLSPDGRVVAAASSALKTLTIWDVTTGREYYTLEEPIRSDAVFSPDSKSFAAFVSGEAIIIWDVATGRALRSLKTPAKDDHAGQIAFSPDGKELSAIVTSYGMFDPGKERSEASALHVWEVGSGKEILRKQIDRRVGSGVFSADGDYHALNAGDGTIRVSKKPKARE